METQPEKGCNGRNSQASRTKRQKESKEKKKKQVFNKITRTCSLSRFLNESYSTLVTSKIEEYRKNDALLAEKSDRDIIQHYIGKIVEYRSKMAYFAGVRGCLFFAFLNEELQKAPSDYDRDQIWSNILDKNGRTLKTTIFTQLCSPQYKKSQIKSMQKVIDFSNNIELLNALDIQEIIDTDISSLSSIVAPSAHLKPLSFELKKSFRKNLSEELFSTLKNRIEFLVDDIIVDHSKDMKKKKSTYIDQIHRKIIGLDYNETDGVIDSIDANGFIEESRDFLGLPKLDYYQHIAEEEKWKFIVNEKWIDRNHRYAISYLQYLLEWSIKEREKAKSVPVQLQRLIRRPAIFPQFSADPDFTLLNLEIWFHVAQKFGHSFLPDDGGFWNESRFHCAISRLQPWYDKKEPIYEFAENDFKVAHSVISEFMNLDFVSKVFIKKTGFRGMKFNYRIATNGESCLLTFFKQIKEPGEENVNAEDKRVNTELNGKTVKCKSKRVKKLIRDIHAKHPEIKAKIANSRRMIQDSIKSGLVGSACADLPSDLIDVDALAEQLISYKISKQLEIKALSNAHRLRVQQQQEQSNAATILHSPLERVSPSSGSGMGVSNSVLTDPARSLPRFNSEKATRFLLPPKSTTQNGSNIILPFLTDAVFSITLLHPFAINPNPFPCFQASEPESDDDKIDVDLQHLSDQMVRSILDS